MPFGLKLPNVETRAAMAEADDIANTRRARFGTATELFDDLEENSGKKARPPAACNVLREVLLERLGAVVVSLPQHRARMRGLDRRLPYAATFSDFGFRKSCRRFSCRRRAAVTLFSLTWP